MYRPRRAGKERNLREGVEAFRARPSAGRAQCAAGDDV